MALPFPPKAATAVINPRLSIASGLVRVVLLNEGTGSPVELVGGGTGTLQNSAAWSTADTNLGTTVQFSAGATTSISFGQGGLSHGNGNVSVFFGVECPTLGGVDHRAGSIAGTGIDTYHFGVAASGALQWILSGVVVIESASAVAVVAGSYYTIGMGYTKGTSCRFNAWNQTTSAAFATPDTVANAGSPAQVANASTVGSKYDATESWASDLGFLLVYNRVLADVEFAELHADPYAPFRPTAWRSLLLGVG